MNLFRKSNLAAYSLSFQAIEPQNNARVKCLPLTGYSERSQVTRQPLPDIKGLSGTGKYKSILVVKDS